MTFIAVLILVPATSLHAWGPGDAVPGVRGDSYAVGALIRPNDTDNSPGDPAGIGGCDDEDWDDDEGGPLLDAPAVPHLFRQEGAPPRRCGSPMISAPSLPSPHLRC